MRNCLTVPVGHVAGLTDALAALLADRDLRERLGAAASETASRFSEAAFLARFEAMLEAIV